MKISHTVILKRHPDSWLISVNDIYHRKISSVIFGILGMSHLGTCLQLGWVRSGAAPLFAMSPASGRAPYSFPSSCGISSLSNHLTIQPSFLLYARHGRRLLQNLEIFIRNECGPNWYTLVLIDSLAVRSIRGCLFSETKRVS